jgi:hypothetical protein
VDPGQSQGRWPVVLGRRPETGRDDLHLQPRRGLPTGGPQCRGARKAVEPHRFLRLRRGLRQEHLGRGRGRRPAGGRPEHPRQQPPGLRLHLRRQIRLGRRPLRGSQQAVLRLRGAEVARPRTDKYLHWSIEAGLSPDGKLVAGDFAGSAKTTSSYDQRLRYTGKKLYEIHGQQLLAWVDDKRLIAFDIASGEERVPCAARAHGSHRSPRFAER